MNTSVAMDRLKAILVELGIPRESLHDRTLLHQDLQLDSTEMVEIVLGLKQNLGVSLKLGGRQDLTLAQVCDRIEEEMLAQTRAIPSADDSGQRGVPRQSHTNRVS